MSMRKFLQGKGMGRGQNHRKTAPSSRPPAAQRVNEGNAVRKPVRARYRKPPKTLGEHGRKLWRRLVEAYNLDEAALVYLENACLSQDREAEASAAIAEKGITFSDRWGQ